MFWLPVFRGLTPETTRPAPRGAALLEAEPLPNVKSAEKRMRTNEIRRERNRAFRSRLRSALKKVRSADSAEAGMAALGEASSLLDRAARKRIIHPNKAARTKSRLRHFIGRMS
jgi:small subunit ribosomal protein S20